MVDSRQKGRTAELNARDVLRKDTGLQWERVPMSGALDPKHKLKGDLYVPGENIKYCVEVKHYKDDHLTSKLLTGKNPTLLEWWKQTVREAEQIEKEPLLLFKYDRSKWFAAFTDLDLQLTIHDSGFRYFTIMPDDIVICLLADFCALEEFIDVW